MRLNLSHPVIILVRGLPGSGKSYVAAELGKALAPDQVVMLDPDAIDFNSQAYADHVATCKAEGTDEKLWPYRFLRAQAYAGIEANKIVIWNQPFTNREIFDKMVARFHEHATTHDLAISLLVVEVMLDPEVARKRVQERKAADGHGPSADVFDRFVREYDSFAGEGYDVVTVQGDADVSNSVASILNTLEKLS